MRLKKEIEILTERIKNDWNNLEMAYELGVINDDEMTSRRNNILKFEKLLDNMKETYRVLQERKVTNN